MAKNKGETVQRKSIFLFTVIVQAMALLPWQVEADEYPAKDPQAEDPPAEALASCAGKDPGDIIIVHCPQGEKRTAVCQESEGQISAAVTVPCQPQH